MRPINLLTGNLNDQLSQGVSWSDTTDTYQRLGSLWGIATGASAKSSCPIQSAMKRCMVTDDEAVNYFVDPSSPIMKQGESNWIIKGNATSTSANHLVNTNGTFLTAPLVVVGQVVHNITANTYATVTVINSATNLTLSADIILTGNAYEIGNTMTGAATSTATGTLNNTGVNFTTLGVVAGMVVKNLTTGTYSSISVVAATALTLSRADVVITSGNTYEIGNANYGGADGQVMVQIPKFYFKMGVTGADHFWNVSLLPLIGYVVHPAFIRDGIEVPYRYHSAFEGSMYDASASAMTASGSTIYASGDKLCSVAGQWAKTNESRASFDAMCTSRGATWRQHDFYLLSAIQLLYLIEYASFNSQSMIGAGRTALSGTWAANSLIGMTGFSIKNGNGTANVSIGGSSGYLTDYMTYNGIENFFGNVWKFIGLMSVNGGVGTTNPMPMYATGNKAHYNAASAVNMDLIVNNTNLGVTNVGYASNLENCVGFIPSAVGAGSTTKITDYYWQYSVNGGWRAPFFGGCSAGGACAGAFCLDVNSSPSAVLVDVGSRLCL